MIMKISYHDGPIKWMYFLIEDDDLLEKCDTIWDKLSVTCKKRIFENQSKILWG